MALSQKKVRLLPKRLLALFLTSCVLFLSLAGCVGSVAAAEDTVAPTVSVNYPYNNSRVIWMTSVSAQASDAVGVVKVEFYVDGVLKATDTTVGYSFVWNTTLGPDGLHILTAKAYDAAGNVGTSSPVTVTVDNTAPVLVIQQPTAGQVVSGVITISGTANDPTTGVKTMRLYVDGVSVDSKLVSPPQTSYNWSFTYNTVLLANGSHIIKVESYDLMSTMSSRTVTVTVENGGVVNQPPVVSAGHSYTALLHGSASDDGLPIPPGTLTVLWSKVSGPGTVTFSAPTLSETDAAFSLAGSYVLRFTANDGTLSTSVDITVVVG